MADTKGPTLMLGIDARGAKQGSEEYKAAISGIVSATSQAESAYKGSATALSGLAAVLPDAAAKQKQFVDSVMGLKTNLVTSTSAISQYGDGMRKLSTNMEDTRRRATDLSKDLALVKLNGSQIQGGIGTLKSLEVALKQGRISAVEYAAAIQRLQVQVTTTAPAVSKLKAAINSNVGMGIAQGVGMGVFMQLAQLPGEIIKITSAAENMERAMRFSVGSVEGASQALGSLYGVASRVGAPIQDLTQLFSSVTRAVGEMGVSQERIVNVVEGVATSLSLSGTSAGAAGGAMLQFAQSLQGGTVRAEEFNSMLEGMPVLLQAASRHVDGANGSLGELRKMVIAGTLSSEDFFNAVEKGSKDLQAQAGAMGQTWDQVMSGMSNNVFRLINQINTATGATSMLKSAFSELSKIAQGVGQGIAAIQGDLEAKLEIQKRRVENFESLRKMGDKVGLGSMTMPETKLQTQKDKLKGLESQMGDRRAMDYVESLAKSERTKRQKDALESIPTEKEKLELMKRQLEAQVALSSASDKGLEKKKAEVALAKMQQDKDKKEAASKIKNPEMLAQANRAIDMEYAAKVAQAEREASAYSAAQSKKGARSAASGARKAEAAERKRQREEEAAVKLEERTGEKWESFEQSAASTFYRNTGDELKQIEEARKKMLDQLSELKLPGGKTEGDRSAIAGDINKGFDEKITEVKQKQQETVDELISSTELKLLASEDRITDNNKRKLEIQLEFIERRRTAELAALDDTAKKTSMAPETKTKLVNLIDRTAINDSKAMKDSMEENAYWGNVLEDGFKSMGTAASSAFMDAITKGGELKTVIAGLGEDIQKMLIQSFVMKPLGKLMDQGISMGMSMLGGLLSSGAGSADFGSTGAGGGTMSGSNFQYSTSGFNSYSMARGGAFDKGEIVPFAYGGVVSGPTNFGMSRGRTGLMGEAGPEAIMPLSRGPDGKLGVAGGSKGKTTINVINNNGSAVSTKEEEDDGSGNKQINIMIDKMEAEMSKRATRSGSTLNRAVRSASNPIRKR